MVVQKSRLKNKLLKRIGQNSEEKVYCSICRKEILKEDIEKEEFEYCKSGMGEHYSHSKCINEMIKNK